MQRGKELKEEIIQTQILEDIVKSLEEVSIVRLKNIRNSITSSREYFEGILAVVKEIKQVYQDDKEKKGELAVFLSGDARFSGEINNKVFEEFNRYAESNHCDLMIMGKIGETLFKQRGVFRPYKYFNTPLNFLPENIREISAYLAQYKKVIVFHGKFVNLVTQTNTMSVITANQKAPTSQGEVFQRYIFEPGPKEILAFFEKQLFSSLFKQTILESYLAQIATRIRTIEGSIPIISKRKRMLYLNLGFFKKQKMAKSQEEITKSFMARVGL